MPDEYSFHKFSRGLSPPDGKLLQSNLRDLGHQGAGRFHPKEFNKTMGNLRLFVLIILMGVLGAPSVSMGEDKTPETCTYEVAVWNVKEKRVIEVQKTRHPYKEVTKEETEAATGCTVCSEDQVLVSLPSVPDFWICRKLAPKVKKTLLGLVENGSTIKSIRGYRAIRSKGPIDESGNRTLLSNHSFGTAIDINRELNGLYNRCFEFGPTCRLVLGGHWRPGVPGTLTGDGPVVRAMKRIGFKWGGEIEGRQKDFMHFSLTGY